MKRIAILIPDLRGGGVERVRLVLAREFVKAGYEIELVIMRRAGALLSEAEAEFAIHDLDCPRARSLPFALIKYIRRNRPDVLLAAMWPLTAIAPLAARLSGHQCRVLISEHNIISAQYSAWGWRHKLLMRLSIMIGYRLADCRVGVSKGVAIDMANLSRIRKEAFNVINNPVRRLPDPEWAQIDLANKLWSGGGGLRILTVGALKAVKNHSLLIRAFARLDLKDARLLILGDGKEKESLQLLAQELQVASRVIFAGFYADPGPFYQTADLFVLSSNYEGFGNVLVEAMASGLPIVSTDCPSGPREILNDGEFGSLVPVGDEWALASAIRTALKQSSDSQSLRRRVADFEPEFAARAYEQAIRSDVDNSRSLG